MLIPDTTLLGYIVIVMFFSFGGQILLGYIVGVMFLLGYNVSLMFFAFCPLFM